MPSKLWRLYDMARPSRKRSRASPSASDDLSLLAVSSDMRPVPLGQDGSMALLILLMQKLRIKSVSESAGPCGMSSSCARSIALLPHANEPQQPILSLLLSSVVRTPNAEFGKYTKLKGILKKCKMGLHTAKWPCIHERVTPQPSATASNFERSYIWRILPVPCNHSLKYSCTKPCTRVVSTSGKPEVRIWDRRRPSTL